ncbi:MAG: response regulator [Candidatus Omnitrophica bacterium]|nr:response regulator [Candidatus Omnitrophota bacterium]MBU1996491.1 response regulator [Candidatus Omnitrophota bacterium]MBU4334680.1 response regulator [Candidatus Omnitrophota bacterium]
MNRILIIDDEIGVIRYYKKLLESEGYSVLTAKNASEGTMAMIKAKDVDLIMLDINMPEVDGVYMWDVIQEYNDQLKVLIFSVRNIEEQKRYLPFATDYFDKSQSVEILLDKVSRLLGNKKSETIRASS